MALRTIYALARRHGYEDGENCLGAACFFSRTVLLAMRDKRLLAIPALVTSHLGDDHMFGLLVRAAGFELGDFATGEFRSHQVPWVADEPGRNWWMPVRRSCTRSRITATGARRSCGRSSGTWSRNGTS